MENRSFKNPKLLILIALILLVGWGFIFFGEEIKDFGLLAINRFGLMGLFGVTMFLDLVIQPVSPQFLTLGYTVSDSPFLAIGLVAGAASVLAGFLGYAIGFLLLNEKKAHSWMGQKNYQKIHNIFEKHGFWAVLIGANIGIPYSALSWSAGIFRMPLVIFAISAILARVPRFILVGYLGSLL